MAAHRCCSLLSYRTPTFPFSYYSPSSSSCDPIPSYPHHLLRLSQLPPPASLLHRRPSPPISFYRHDDDNNCNRGSRRSKSSFAAAARKREETVQEEGTGDATKGSGTSARGRRLLKVREEKRKREHERLQNYPPWAKILEDACRDDSELRAVLGDSIGNPELMRKRVEERVRTKGRDFRKSKTGSMLAFKVSFRDFNPTDSFIWFELYGAPSDRDVELLGSVVQSWYVMGRLGAFNSTNLQLANSSMDYNPLYDADKTAKAMPSSFHDISDVEFQDNWGRVWVDLGTSDFFAVDVLLNCLTVLSSEYPTSGFRWTVHGRLGGGHDEH